METWLAPAGGEGGGEAVRFISNTLFRIVDVLEMAQNTSAPSSINMSNTGNSTNSLPPETLKIFNKTAFLDIVNSRTPPMTKQQRASVVDAKISIAEKRANGQKKAAERREIVKAEITSKMQQEHENRMHLIEKRFARMKEQEERAFESLYTDVKHSGVSFLQKIDRYLENNKVATQQKFHSMSTRQNDGVFVRCQNQVEDQLLAMKAEVISKKRNQRYQNFLDQDRIKGGLYLDIILAEEYDPFDWQKESIKYKYHPHLNPASKDLVKTETEQLMERFPNGPIPATTTARSKLFPALGRDDMIPTSMWTKMEATPYFDRSEAEQLKRAAGFVKEDKRNKVSTNTKMDHFEVVSAQQVSNFYVIVSTRFCIRSCVDPSPN